MTTANKLTIIRFIFSVAFIVLFYLDADVYSIAAFVVFVLAAITDFLDGYVARKYNQITKLGKLMDPLADKVLVFSALILFVEKGLVFGWIVIIILARDLMIGIFRAVAASQSVVIAADKLGKIKTVFQMTSVIMMLFGYAFKIDIIFTGGNYLLYVALLLTVVSGINYIYRNKEVLEE